MRCNLKNRISFCPLTDLVERHSFAYFVSAAGKKGTGTFFPLPFGRKRSSGTGEKGARPLFFRPLLAGLKTPGGKDATDVPLAFPVCAIAALCFRLQERSDPVLRQRPTPGEQVSRSHQDHGL
jgi:hypothetical protein